MFKGSIPALVTPMRADGAVDFQAWERLLDFHVAEGTDAVVVAGTTGESPTLEPAEVAELVRRAKAHVAGRIANHRGQRHELHGEEHRIVA